MLWSDLIRAFLLAWLFVLLLTGPLRWRHPSRPDSPVAETILFLFLVCFLAIRAGGVCLVPFGPLLVGGYWLPFVLIGLFVLLVIAATSAPARPPRTRSDAEVEAEEAEAVGTVLGVFFWILVIGLLVEIIASYVTQARSGHRVSVRWFRSHREKPWSEGRGEIMNIVAGVIAGFGGALFVDQSQVSANTSAS